MNDRGVVDRPVAGRTGGARAVSARPAEPLVAALLSAAGDAAQRHASRPPVLFIDGRSGSGKSTLASAVVDGVAQSAGIEQGVELVRLDESYPGWDGLAAAQTMLTQLILPELRVPQYDWDAHRITHHRPIPRGRVLVIEGCGAVFRDSVTTARSLGHGVLTAWVACNATERYRRAMARDGDLFRPHWDRWAAQEARHLRVHQPLAYARWIIHTDRLTE